MRIRLRDENGNIQTFTPVEDKPFSAVAKDMLVALAIVALVVFIIL